MMPTLNADWDTKAWYGPFRNCVLVKKFFDYKEIGPGDVIVFRSAHLALILCFVAKIDYFSAALFLDLHAAPLKRLSSSASKPQLGNGSEHIILTSLTWYVSTFVIHIVEPTEPCFCSDHHSKGSRVGGRGQSQRFN